MTETDRKYIALIGTPLDQSFAARMQNRAFIHEGRFGKSIDNREEFSEIFGEEKASVSTMCRCTPHPQDLNSGASTALTSIRRRTATAL